MKKIISACFLFILVLAQTPALADEIVDSKGVTIPCKIETVSAGLIEYTQNGNLYSFQRTDDLLIFNDYVDVRVKIDLQKKEIPIMRYSGQIIAKDCDGVIIRSENCDMHIPWWRVKFIGVYKP